jgi:hypothetical protein
MTIAALLAIVEPATGERIANGSFESPVLEPGGYAEGTDASVPGGMTFSDPFLNDIFVTASVGILRPPNSVGTLAPAFGVQYAVLDSGGYLVIPFFIETPGSYVLDFWVAPQADGYLDYALFWPGMGGPDFIRCLNRPQSKSPGTTDNYILNPEAEGAFGTSTATRAWITKSTLTESASSPSHPAFCSFVSVWWFWPDALGGGGRADQPPVTGAASSVGSPSRTSLLRRWGFSCLRVGDHGCVWRIPLRRLEEKTIPLCMQPFGSLDETPIPKASNEVLPEDGLLNADEISRTISQGLAVYPGLARMSEPAQAMIGALRDASSREDRLHLAEAAKSRHGPEFCEPVVKELISVFVFFIEHFLLDHKLTRLEQAAIIEVRELLGLDEESLARIAKEQIRSLIEVQIDRIQDDYQIDLDEEHFLVHLQEVFGLGYDQLRELWTPHVTELLNDLHLQLSVADRRDIRDQIDQLKSTFCMLGYQPPPVVGVRNVDEVAARCISQSVKDLVWRRDGGKCVKCGSNQLLEFDHIIPFSLGGAGTYRNVQLLCQSCNRSKQVNLH